MKKRILFFLTACILLSALVFSVGAAGTYVVDNGDLLTDGEEDQLAQVLAEVANTHGIDIVVLTTDSLDGKSAMAYADDYYGDYDPGYDDDYDYDYSEEKPSLFQGILVCLVIGIVAGGIVVLIMVSQLKSVRSQPGASCYVKPGSLRLSVSRDLFLYQNTTRRPKPKDNGSSGGRSSGGVHRSSSGRSHGGGGGRF